ncbi:hypothetical protein CCR75_002420 [Bremia lactucae]|uniref:Uncharacterized protein n=1 Tax=Bremia lactucae TaxID=4779 RepID=A0A976ID84_BRELC|nr:hypothetical protein CCR75_002420 [Bremia lactucae]
MGKNDAIEEDTRPRKMTLKVIKEAENRSSEKKWKCECHIMDTSSAASAVANCERINSSDRFQLEW